MKTMFITMKITKTSQRNKLSKKLSEKKYSKTKMLFISNFVNVFEVDSRQTQSCLLKIVYNILHMLKLSMRLEHLCIIDNVRKEQRCPIQNALFTRNAIRVAFLYSSSISSTV